jgi:DNA-binding SARP family transcriptional activator
MTRPLRIRVALLDGFGLRIEGPPDEHVMLDNLPRGVQRLVACVSLAVRPSRAAVAGQLWPEVPEGQAQRNLRSALWRLHRAVPDLVEVSPLAVSLSPGVTVDVHDLVTWAEQVLDPAAGLPDRTIGPAGERGELLPGWYEDWVLLERERLRQLRLHAYEVLARRLTRAGRFCEAAQAAYAAIGIEPLRESAHRALIGVHLAEGNTVEAVRAYERFREMLVDEVGVPPSEHMAQLLRGVPHTRLSVRPAARL